MSSKKIYVVIKGKERGIYDSWDDCFDMVNRYRGAVYKGFRDPFSAVDYIFEEMEYGGPYLISVNGTERHYEDYYDFISDAEEVLNVKDRA